MEFIYPTDSELQEIDRQLMTQRTMDDPLFADWLMPTENAEDFILIWEIEGNVRGLQGLRGIGGAPGRVAAVGASSFMMQPGVYGEYSSIGEDLLLRGRRLGSLDHVTVDDEVARRHEQLLDRRINRLRYIGWTLLSTGTFSVSLPNGIVGHTDSYSVQTYSASDWSTMGTSTPLADFRAVGLLGRGKGCSFGGQARALMNKKTGNYLFGNSNAADLGGKRVLGGNTPIGLPDVNRILAQEDLPEIMIYDEGYVNDSSVWTPFIPDDKVVVVGRRPGGVRIAAYRFTMNINNQNAAPGPYVTVIDKGSDGPGKSVPRTIEVHDGHNGGPVIYYPDAVVVMSV